MPNLSPTMLLILNTLLPFQCMTMTALINHIPAPNFLIAYFTISLTAWSNAFPRSTKANLSCSWHTVNIAFTVPLPDIEPKYMHQCLPFQRPLLCVLVASALYSCPAQFVFQSSGTLFLTIIWLKRFIIHSMLKSPEANISNTTPVVLDTSPFFILLKCFLQIPCQFEAVLY